ncbi:hypothetical protein [Nocardioides sp.]|uniref:hypothetical protein n=1 Tax=Nocardioides sp. TaxID=35761 RepID=UPI00271CD0E4|nr:hypothetical protein [Nocardioides sp.]MDO9456774.1 hypothetical protein [Nocardioides sp.]
MTLNDTLTRTLPRKRRTALGLVFASVVLSGTLTACGSEAENTTCGELKGKSTDDVIKLFKEAAEDEGGDDADAALEAIKSLDDLGDEAKDGFADTLKAQCDGEDDDTKLKDAFS